MIRETLPALIKNSNKKLNKISYGNIMVLMLNEEMKIESSLISVNKSLIRKGAASKVRWKESSPGLFET